MRFVSVKSAEEITRYIAFASEVYAGQINWVPPDEHHMVVALTDRAEATPHRAIQPFWIEEEGRILATVTAVIDNLYDTHWNERAGHLVFFEALPDNEAAAELLLGHACDWLKGQGCQFARASFLPDTQQPLTIDAYDVVPTLFHTLNPPYYHRYIKNAGFITEKGAVEYQVAFTPELAKQYRELVAAAQAAGYRLRQWDFDRLEEEGRLFTGLLNETFSGHWAMPQFGLAQIQSLIDALKDLMVPEFLYFAEIAGETVGFVVSFPDLHQALHPMRGKDLEQNMPEFETRFGEIDHGILLIIGVSSQARGRGVNVGLAAKSYLEMIERGYKSASYTVVLDDNFPSRRTAEKLGARIARNFAIYRKELF